jgi:hypothetical protein
LDTLALGTAIMGAMIGVGVRYWVVKRRWWKAIGGFAIGSAVLLNFVTGGVHSRLENRARFIATIILVAAGVVSLVADANARRRTE